MNTVFEHKGTMNNEVVYNSGKQCLWVPTHDMLVGGSLPQSPVDRMINHAATHLAAL